MNGCLVDLEFFSYVISHFFVVPIALKENNLPLIILSDGFRPITNFINHESFIVSLPPNLKVKHVFGGASLTQQTRRL
jgi:hypothetical protein